MSQPSDRRILVIDDDSNIHDFVRRVLQKHTVRATVADDSARARSGDTAAVDSVAGAWEVDSAYCGEQGLEMVRAAAEQGRPYILAFVDIRMPGWDGIETTRHIWHEFPDLQVVICTAHSAFSWSEIIERLGESDRLFILPKPFDIAQLRQLATVVAQRCRTERELHRHREHLEQLAEQRATELRGARQKLSQNEARLAALVAERTTELAEANRALEEESTKARAATQAKSEFLANMSHELRTPLHGILSYASFGLKKVATASCEDLTKYFRQIECSGKGLLALITDLLDLSKLEAGAAELPMRRTNLHALVLTTVEEFVAAAADRDIRITCVQPEFDTSIIGAYNELGQVFRNLLSNAVKYSPDGSRVDIHFAQEDDSIVVSVQDEGVGIPPEELETVFDKFIQSSKTRTGAGGTGLGLAICREVVVAHRGTIWAESRPQSGTVIKMKLPINPMTAEPIEEPPPQAALF